MQQPLLEFVEINYIYPGTQQPALHNLNLKIPVNKKCALIGQNGCGKTTLFLLANGLYQPQKGIIKWQGQNIKYGKVRILNMTVNH